MTWENLTRVYVNLDRCSQQPEIDPNSIYWHFITRGKIPPKKNQNPEKSRKNPKEISKNPKSRTPFEGVIYPSFHNFSSYFTSIFAKYLFTRYFDL